MGHRTSLKSFQGPLPSHLGWATILSRTGTALLWSGWVHVPTKPPAVRRPSRRVVERGDGDLAPSFQTHSDRPLADSASEPVWADRVSLKCRRVRASAGLIFFLTRCLCLDHGHQGEHQQGESHGFDTNSMPVHLSATHDQTFQASVFSRFQNCFTLTTRSPSNVTKSTLGGRP